MSTRFNQWLVQLLWSSWSASAPARSRRTRVRLEPLEDRLAPAIFNVNSMADILFPPPGVVTLRSAIQEANATPGGNTINLTVPGTYRIALPGANSGNNTSGAFAILPSGGNLNIVNTSGGAVTVDGNHLDRVFDVNPNFDPNNPTAKFLVTMQGFTIDNGIASPGDGTAGSGGGIRDQGNASLTLTNMVVRNNLATADGGGISMENTLSVPWTLTINNSSISNNHAGDAGGGVETDGSGNVFLNSGTAVTGNTSVNQGAGVWLDAVEAGNVFQGANLTVTGTLVGNNQALDMLGGGIGNAGNGTVSLIGSTIQNNFSGGSGGGFADENNQGTLNVLDTLISSNTAVGSGGGIAEGDAIASITNTEITANTSGATGGGAFSTGVTLFVQSSTIDNNLASGSGGGIELETTGTGLNASSITNSTVTANTALNNTGANGGGIDAATGDLVLLNDTINANFAGAGGGVFWPATAGTSVRVENTIIAQNIAATGTDVAFPLLFTSSLNGAQQVPPTVTPGTGAASIALSADQTTITVNESWTGLVGIPIAAHLHNAPAGANGPVATDASGNNIEFAGVPATTTGAIPQQSFTVNTGFASQLLADNIYTNIHTTFSPSGEIRGQFSLVSAVFTDLGGNLIGVNGAGSGFSAASTQSGTAANPLNALLGALGNNGGPTIGAPGTTVTLPTETLLPGSTALAKGILSRAPTVDERGLARGTTGTIDVGAVEVTVPLAAPTHLQATPGNGQVTLTWTAPLGAVSFNIYRGTISGGEILVQSGVATTSYTDLGLTNGTTYFYQVSGISAGGIVGPRSTEVSATPQSPVTLNFPAGFTGATGLTFNGSAVINGSSLQLTDGKTYEAGSAFSTSAQSIANFSTQFTFQLSAGSTTADGFAFVIQSNGPTALGPNGAGLGYGPDSDTGTTGGIPNSVAVKFDLQESPDSTGLYTDGAPPTYHGSIDLTPTGINLHSGDKFLAQLNYDGATLDVTITDTKTGATATQAYSINIPVTVGGSTAYVGFTGATGGLTATQDILTWTYNPSSAMANPSTGVKAANVKSSISTGAAVLISAIADPTPSAIVTKAYTGALQVQVTDAFGNPVRGVRVTFKVPAIGAGGTFGGHPTATVLTDVNGVAKAPALTANTKAGSFTVTASATGVHSMASFGLTNLAGPAAKIVFVPGMSQSAKINTTFTGLLVVRVVDAFGNGVSGAQVTFTVQPNTKSGAGATLDEQFTAAATTTTTGLATAPPLKANAKRGSFIVTATITGAADVMAKETKFTL